MTEADQSSIRNFKDFLLQYNKMTEQCFTKCTSNFNYRTLTDVEINCVESCSSKALMVNQKIMQTFMVLQSKKQELMAEENAKQQQEFMKQQQEALLAQQQEPQSTDINLPQTSENLLGSESSPSQISVEENIASVPESTAKPL